MCCNDCSVSVSSCRSVIDICIFASVKSHCLPSVSHFRHTTYRWQMLTLGSSTIFFLFQSSDGNPVRIFLASAFSSNHALCPNTETCPDSPRDFGAIHIIYLLIYLCLAWMVEVRRGWPFVRRTSALETNWCLTISVGAAGSRHQVCIWNGEVNMGWLPVSWSTNLNL